MALLQTPGVHPLAPDPSITVFHSYAFEKGYSNPETMIAERILNPLEMVAKQLKISGYHVYRNNLTILFKMVEAELNKYGLEIYIHYRSLTLHVFYEYINDEISMPDLSGLYFQTDMKVKQQGYRLLQRLKEIGFDKITDNYIFDMLTSKEVEEVDPELMLEKEFNEAVNNELHMIPDFAWNTAIGKTDDPDDKKLNALVQQAFDHCNNIYNIQWLKKDFNHDSQQYPSVIDSYNIYHSFDDFDKSLPYSSNKAAILREIGEHEPTFITHSIKLLKDEPLNIPLFANYGKSIIKSLKQLAQLIPRINNIYYRKEYKAIRSSKWVADLRKYRRTSKRES